MKRVLIVVYDFPPYRTSGVYRPVKFVKYLSRLGWEPIVLTVKNHPTDTVDGSLLDEIPTDTKIYKAYSIEPKRWEQWFFNRFFKQNNNNNNSGSLLKTEKNNNDMNSFSFKTLLKKVFLSPISRFTHSYLYCPDSRIGWQFKAVPLGKKIVKDEKIDLIFSSSPPETNHIVGYKISKRTGVPLVVDFRDPWTDNFIRGDNPEYTKAKEKKIERRILKHASKIIHIGSRFIGLSLDSFPEIAPDKHTSITNGYDEEDFSSYNTTEIYKRNKTKYFNILNVGTIYESSGFDSLLNAWEILARDDQFNENTKVSFIGNLLPSQKKILTSEPFSKTSQCLGFKKHNEAMEMMMSADLLLLLQPSGGHKHSPDKIAPGKLFELVRSGRPILLIGCDGEASEIVLKSSSGFLVEKDDIDEIVNRIKILYQKKMSGELNTKPNWEYISQFSRENLTKKLVTVFNEVINRM